MTRAKKAFRMWQRNCRSYENKKSVLQETHGIAKLAGYRSFGYAKRETRALTTLVKRSIACVQHSTGIEHIDNILLGLLPQTKTGRSLFILNIYSNPMQHKHKFKNLFQKTLRLAGENLVVIAGDFNAPHTTWGYLYTRPKGRALWNDSQELGLMLVTDPGSPTRTGTALNRDTTPDLTFTKNIEQATWHNTLQDLGSDHCISELRFTDGPSSPIEREIKLIDWELLCRTREATEQRSITDRTMD